MWRGIPCWRSRMLPLILKFWLLPILKNLNELWSQRRLLTRAFLCLTRHCRLKGSLNWQSTSNFLSVKMLGYWSTLVTFNPIHVSRYTFDTPFIPNRVSLNAPNGIIYSCTPTRHLVQHLRELQWNPLMCWQGGDRVLDFSHSELLPFGIQLSPTL